MAGIEAAAGGLVQLPIAADDLFAVLLSEYPKPELSWLSSMFTQQVRL